MNQQTDSHTEKNQPSQTDLLNLTGVGTQSPLFKTSWLLYVSIGVAALVLALIFLVYFSQQSLPGESLYRLKTRIVERGILATKFSSRSRTLYTTGLIVRRLEELKTLSRDVGTTTPETLTTVAGLIQGHTHEALTTLADATSYTEGERIDALAQVVFVTRAHETLGNMNEEISPIEENLGETQNSATAALDTAIQSFASTSAPDVVGGYLSTHIGKVDEGLKNVAPGSNAERYARMRIQNVQEALIDSQIADAITYILKAEEAIAVDQYLFDSERGPVEGVPLEPSVMPEGS